MRNLTPRQESVYNFIVEYTQEHLYPPTVREIADGVGLRSISAIPGYLKKLEDEGYVELNSNQPRCITLVGYKLVKE